MSLKAIITTILLGTSSLAAADTGYVTVRDHRTQPLPAPAPIYQAPAPVYQVQPAPPASAQADIYKAAWVRHVVQPVVQPVTLASSQRLNGREIIKVNPSLRSFTKLELRAKAGRTNLDKIMITFENGKTQTIDCNRTLQGNESFFVDLQGNQRNIKRIVLVGKSGRRASLDVLAA
ncbi:MAG TPA: PXPV repeat protein [Kofleriaceae bacterium]|jgi:hypothetical protein|nr:PXPV repeat protein [Kofleriaceae bacterium]